MRRIELSNKLGIFSGVEWWSTLHFTYFSLSEDVFPAYAVPMFSVNERAKLLILRFFVSSIFRGDERCASVIGEQSEDFIVPEEVNEDEIENQYAKVLDEDDEEEDDEEDDEEQDVAENIVIFFKWKKCKRTKIGILFNLKMEDVFGSMQMS